MAVEAVMRPQRSKEVDEAVLDRGGWDKAVGATRGHNGRHGTVEVKQGPRGRDKTIKAVRGRGGRDKAVEAT